MLPLLNDLSKQGTQDIDPQMHIWQEPANSWITLFSAQTKGQKLRLSHDFSA
jgi:hypothetical protein